ASFEKNHHTAVVLKSDLRDIDPRDIANRAGVREGDCLAVIGCPPCQGFSSHRPQASAWVDPRNELVDCFADFVISLMPPSFVFENVPRMLTHRDAPWTQAKARLERAGYRIAQGILDAANFGVPQRRKRFVAIGLRWYDKDPRLPA